MEPKTPEQLKQELHTITNLAWIAIAGFDLLVEKARTEPEWNMLLKTRYHSKPFHISPMLDSLRLPDDHEVFRYYEHNLFVMLSRTMVSNAFTFVETYCQTHAIQEFEALDWYSFARALRNAFTHNGKLARPRKKEDRQRLLDSVWRDKKIDETMFDKYIPFTFFDFEDVIRLIDDLKEFCGTLPDPSDNVE
ncbi:MAG: hypothetical protein JXJ20_00395 [Anaerolineae bacterium]|nr:hypothetical protein [Anaerolineae bacterium]